MLRVGLKGEIDSITRPSASLPQPLVKPPDRRSSARGFACCRSEPNSHRSSPLGDGRVPEGKKRETQRNMGEGDDIIILIVIIQHHRLRTTALLHPAGMSLSLSLPANDAAPELQALFLSQYDTGIHS